MRCHSLQANLYKQGMNGEICTETFDDLGVVFGKFLTRLEARGQMVPKGNFDDLSYFLFRRVE